MNGFIYPLGLATAKAQELKQLIDDNPDLKIAVLVDSEIISDTGYYTCYAPEVSFSIEEILDCEVPYQDYVVSNRDDFVERMEEYVADQVEQMNISNPVLQDKIYEQYLKKELDKYEPYWKKVIVIKAGI